ncbi:MAG: preprotein translocase subunit YajC [Candidatus Helarchaeota archaeon]|nr:preprotein translocase subunit YajC [Candidatus Helarchaeota archaeon]
MMGGAQGSSGSAGILTLLPFILIFLIIYFLMIRPQIRRQKEIRIMLDNLRKGDKVITSGGILGTITGIKEKDNTIILKLDQNVKIEVLKTAISKVISKE